MHMSCRRRKAGCTVWRTTGLLVAGAIYLGLLLVDCLANTPRAHAQPAVMSEGDRLQAIKELGRLISESTRLYNEGKYQEAIAPTQRALAISEHVLGPEHPDTISGLSNLAATYRDSGAYGQAEHLFQQVLAIRRKVQGSESPETALTLSHLAALYLITGAYEQAEPLFREALEIREKVLGPEHPDTATALSNLAVLYRDTGAYGQAESLLRRALETQVKVLGPRHRSVAPTAINLAVLYRTIGEYAKAVPLFQWGLAIREKVLGPWHPDTATALTNFALLYCDVGAYNEAEPLYKRALAINEKALGSEHPDTAAVLDNLVLVYHATGAYAQAVPLSQRALAIREKVLGPEHPDTAASLNNSASLYEAMGQYEQALPLFQRAFRIGYGTDNQVLLCPIAGNLGAFYQQQEQLGPAIFYYKLAVNACQQLRAGAKEMEMKLQSSLTNRVEGPYRKLAQLLIREGRLVEAEQVLAMLKEQEQFEFVRRDSVSDPRHTRTTLSTTEQALANRLTENARELVTLYTKLEGFENRNGSSVGDEHAREQLRERLAMESERFDGLLKDVEQLLSEQTKGNNVKDLATLSKSAGTLRDVLFELHKATGVRPAVVYFLPSEAATTFMVLTKDGTFSIHGGLGEKQLNEHVAALRDSIALRNTSYRKAAQLLYEALITPIEPQLKTAQVDTVMLYLTGTLRYLPFAALYDATDHKHLIEKYNLSLFTAAVQANLTKETEPIWSAAALGLSKSQPGFDALPSVVQELSRIVRESKDQSSKGVLTGSRYLDEKFTRQQFMRLLEGSGHYPVLHIATHFKLSPGNEVDSFLLLGNGDTITLNQIRTDQGIKLRGYDLVTLSACETAVGGGSGGVEVEGLGVTVQNKGAMSVLATLWKVQDTGTAWFMEEFYRARGEKRKVTKAAALRQAQLSLLQGRVKADNPNIDLSHPYYWAPFVLMGNWK